MKEALKLNITLTEPQAEFLALSCRYPLFTGGFGSGKSTTMIVAAFIDATHSVNSTITIYEPTYQLVRDVAVPAMEKFLTQMNLKYRLNKQEHSIVLECQQVGNFEFRSYDNPDVLIGYESYRSHVDEIDTLDKEKARKVWEKIIGRSRQWPTDLSEKHMKFSEKSQRYEPVNRVSAYSTPEGYKFTYQNWKLSRNEEYKYVQAKTSSNVFLNSDYEDSLRASFPAKRAQAYLDGEWVNMESGSVYHCYDRELHDSSEQIREKEPLYIGCDFNVTKQAATIFVQRDGGREWHAVAELVNMYDTPEMISIIKNRYKDHEIYVYPDAAGRARHSSDASVSDISLLKSAGFHIRARSKNPLIKDRVAATNKAISDGRVRINSINCPNVSRCLEQQAYDNNGEPDKKSGYDHQNDATSYPIAYEMPIRTRLFSVPVKWAC